MDFNKLQSLKFELPPSNATMTSLPSTLLDALIPGYGIMSQIIFRIFGFDIGLAVSGCLVIFGLAQGSRLLYFRCYGIFASYFTASILIEDDDQLFRQIMEWIAEQRMTKMSRDLLAVTKWVNAYDDSDDDTTATDYEDVLDEKGIFNYEKWASNIPPRYEPNYGTDRFWFEGRRFTFDRVRREKQRSLWRNNDEQTLTISCIGRSTEPIKDLLNHVKRWTLTKENKSTSVFRPAPKEDRGDCSWDRQSCRPSRPISTVSLDQHQKGSIVNDINEYLHPASSRWYAARGIPYRRGYLFYGPPGTGKTSLSFALAGIFGLDIYCISLMEVGLTESDLNKLFSDLPRRCIVLLEDIDSAGLRRPDDPPVSTDSPKKGSQTPEVADNSGSEDGVVHITKKDALSRTKGTPTVLKSLISLSGLLNTIDGAASHEGRVLIMTTNRPESLDEALIRPGRIDMQVRFTLATREQTRDIYKRMYSTENSQERAAALIEKKIRSSSTHSRPNTPKENPKREEDEFLELLNKETVLEIVEAEELAGMAEQFADSVPEGLFSPAEIQGFLLTRKKEPRKALEDVVAWRDGELERKRKGENVVHS